MKRWCYRIALCLCVCLLTLGLCGRMEAAEVVASGTCGENLTWSLDGDGVLTIRGTGEMKDYQTDSTPWEGNRWKIKSVVVESGVTSIGANAFYDCSALTSIALPDSVTSIGERAFSYCGALTGITLPDSVTEIGKYAFIECSALKSITLPDCITEIGERTFFGCSALTSITLPDSVTEIGAYAFYKCDALTSIVLPANITSIGQSAFFGCSSLAQITLPARLREISDNTFTDCSSLQTITIPQGVTSIRYAAFSGCSGLTNVTIPDSVTSIGGYVFRSCSSLKQITLPDSLTSLAWDVFRDCSSLERIVLPARVTEIPGEAFWGCTNLKSVTLPDDVEIIGGNAFLDCINLEQITLPDGVRVINGSVFQGCSSLKSIELPDGVTYISESSFQDCSSLTEIRIPDKVWAIGKSAFQGCSSLQRVTLSRSVTSIGESAFEGCGQLQRIVIPDQVTSIGAYAFYNCKALKAAGFAGDAPELGTRAFWMDGEDAAVSAIPGLALSYIAGKENWTTPSYSGYPTTLWDCKVFSHWYLDTVTEPTCTAEGYTAHTCTVCGDRYRDQIVPALGHQYADGFCIRCGAQDSSQFSDVSANAWYTSAVQYAVEHGLMAGVGNNRFGPEEPMTRAMLVTVLWRYAGRPEAGKNPFTDVPAGQWYTEAVTWAAENGVVSGVGNGRFAPNGNITREQMASILFRYAKLTGLDTSKRGELAGFPDEGQAQQLGAGGTVLGRRRGDHQRHCRRRPDDPEAPGQRDQSASRLHPDAVYPKQREGITKRTKQSTFEKRTPLPVPFTRVPGGGVFCVWQAPWKGAGTAAVDWHMGDGEDRGSCCAGRGIQWPEGR